MASRTLSADYTSPSASQTFTASLPSLSNDPKTQTVADKTAYLSALRAGATQIQAEINAVLTQRMEDDKMTEAAGKLKLQEDKAEEMYGEEEGEDD
ncbi:hypothetical protein LTR15_012527 [Elasticomyces elasticus]|nr:hypothetical protein LTR15_012527 [Elasticomyces elasticus]